MFDAKMVADEMGLMVKSYVEKTTAPLLAQISALQAKVDAIPSPVSSEEVRDLVEGRIKSLDFPEPQKGEKGDDGKSVNLDDVRPMLEAEVAKWALDFERRASGVLERAVDKLPKPADGRDGADGLDLKDLEVSLADDGRTFVFKLADAERTKEWRLTPPIVLDAGLFDEGKTYTKGDAVTWNGALWIAQSSDPVGKPGDSPDWRLSVKRGREGKPGENGKPGEKGQDGRDGRDLTQMGPDGSKWR